jgi:hypothetical protein
MTNQCEIIHTSGSKMTGPECRRLEELEGVIRVGLKTVFQVGEALSEIRDLRLYRENYRSFEEYTYAVWGIGRDYADRSIRASVVKKNLTNSQLIEITNADNCQQNQSEDNQDILPTNESQTRPLATLSPEDQSKVWREVVIHHQKTGEHITGKLVGSFVKKWKQDRALQKIEDATSQLGAELSNNVSEEAQGKDSSRGKYTDNRNTRESEEFREAAIAFFRVLDAEVRGNWRTTSKQVVVKQLKALAWVAEHS